MLLLHLVSVVFSHEQARERLRKLGVTDAARKTFCVVSLGLFGGVGIWEFPVETQQALILILNL